jgi:hypothetical protein
MVLRYYHGLSVELSQYAEPPLKSPKTRTAIIAVYALGLVFSFAFIALGPKTFLSSSLQTSSTAFIAFLVILLSFFSPLVEYLSIWVQLANRANASLVSTDFWLALVSAVIFFVPFGYVLYKTRKEIETRFFKATGGMPKKLEQGYKMHRVSHGRPILRGFVGAISGVVVFPWYVYHELFKAKQGSIVYRKVTKPHNEWGPYLAQGDPHKLYFSTEETNTFDIGEELAQADKEAMDQSQAPICPKCKKSLVYLEDHEKWWCKKCKKAYAE